MKYGSPRFPQPGIPEPWMVLLIPVVPTIAVALLAALAVYWTVCFLWRLVK